MLKSHVLFGLALLLAPSLAQSAELRWHAARLFDEGVPKQLQLTHDGGALELARGVLVEDDGPAAGYSYQPNEERLGESIAIRKQLLLTDPRAERATLLVGGNGQFQFTVNDEPRTLTSLGKVGNYWQAFELPTSALRMGINDIVIRGKGMLWIARDDEYPAGSRERTRHPNRSAKSRDGGKTWNDKQLGTGDDLDGEYYVRLALDQYRPRGEWTSAVIDLANLKGDVIGAPVERVSGVKIAADVQNVESGQCVLQYRVGKSPVQSAATWSFWQSLPSNGELPGGTERFLQLRAVFTTDDPRQTPELRSIVVQTADPTSATWHTSLRVVESTNAPLVRSAIPFEYEPFDHPSLRQLREQFRLDDVVRGAKTELETITRLAVWASQQFRHGGHLKTLYPPWNALEILRPHDDGTPIGGFCQQFNLVFLQACESFGIAGRAVSIGPGDHKFTARGGHEVVELWSHEYRKWMYIDGNMAWYAVDQATQTPLSLLELHDRQLDALTGQPYPAVEIVTLTKADRAWTALTDWPPFVELRMIPRSNFLAVRAPLPLNQGMRGWSWTGHYVWHDARSPAPLIYGQRVTRRGDWEWSLDQVQLWVTAATTPSELHVHCDTVAAGLRTLEVQFDDGSWSPCDTQVTWKLHAGRNRLALRTMNTLDRPGAATVIVIER